MSTRKLNAPARPASPLGLRPPSLPTVRRAIEKGYGYTCPRCGGTFAKPEPHLAFDKIHCEGCKALIKLTARDMVPAEHIERMQEMAREVAELAEGEDTDE